MRPIEKIVIHCAATPNGQPFDAADIDAWHRERGWKGIGYHYVVLLNGEVQTGRREAEVGAHAAGFNARSLGICLIGTDRFTLAQWETLGKLVALLKSRYPGAVVLGHRDLPRVAKACPGFDVTTWLVRGPQEGHILTAPPEKGGQT
jgi:N-acetylmuramoyl-L-alanine amidase